MGVAAPAALAKAVWAPTPDAKAASRGSDGTLMEFCWAVLACAWACPSAMAACEPRPAANASTTDARAASLKEPPDAKPCASDATSRSASDIGTPLAAKALLALLAAWAAAARADPAFSPEARAAARLSAKAPAAAADIPAVNPAIAWFAAKPPAASAAASCPAASTGTDGRVAAAAAAWAEVKAVSGETPFAKAVCRFDRKAFMCSGDMPEVAVANACAAVPPPVASAPASFSAAEVSTALESSLAMAAAFAAFNSAISGLPLASALARASPSSMTGPPMAFCKSSWTLAPLARAMCSAWASSTGWPVRFVSSTQTRRTSSAARWGSTPLPSSST
ncbi:hypothetical protein D3877_24405 [Azospirillum cavernae]|uniref:Uncharacterized protein n=1 Tax=Azospirillum cavernae TaxID=2320860 RepID=A0A418VPQ5_9PROT|nr:hypothetical protein D3877_24405 [Azospirillum cavernae]